MPGGGGGAGVVSVTVPSEVLPHVHHHDRLPLPLQHAAPEHSGPTLQTSPRTGDAPCTARTRAAPQPHTVPRTCVVRPVIATGVQLDVGRVPFPADMRRAPGPCSTRT